MLPPAVAQAEADAAVPDPRIVTVDNGLGLQLLNQLSSGNPANVSLSPLSIGLVLEIVYNGAQGSAATAMAQTLQLGSLTADDMNTANAALQGSLDGLNSQVQLSLANSLWQHGADPLVPAFVQVNENDYGAALGNLDGTPGTVLGDPNAWISSETQGLIKQALPPNFNPAGVVALVINAIYFKGAWTTAFDPSQTTAAPFTRADGTQVSAQMMTSPTTSYAYSQGSGFQAVMLPYAQGRASMLLVLPDASTSLGSLLAQLTPATLDSWVAGLQSTLGTVKLPKFSTSFSDSLVPALTALGMGTAFGGDFSGIFPGGTLTDVLHDSVVQVDENGTVAAATTIGLIGTAVAVPEFTVVLDHPFFFAIRDNQTGTLLFVGVIQDPTQ